MKRINAMICHKCGAHITIEKHKETVTKRQLKRDLEIVKLTAKGMSYKDIAKKLGLSYTHVKRIGKYMVGPKNKLEIESPAASDKGE
jgi:DNA-binding NarL/FixJ family response regulator